MATKAFDPYREWLGLDLAARDPNHYQLLDLPELEQDAAKIHSAADRALARVRSHRPGAQAAAWARLLDELAAAKNCLTDPVRKSAYDASLGQAELCTPDHPTQARQTGPTQDREEGSERSRSIVPEVAFVNQIPDLFPPGMQPSARAAPTPAKSPLASPSSTPARGGVDPQPSRSTSNAATSPVTASPLHARKPKKNPPPIPPATPPTTLASQPDEPATASESSVGNVSTPLPPAPVNAHVAPPRQPRQSMLPVVVSITALLIVATLIIMMLAMRGESDESSALTPRPALPASPNPADGTPATNHPSKPPSDQIRRPTSSALAMRQSDNTARHVTPTRPAVDTASHPPPENAEQPPSSNASTPNAPDPPPATSSDQSAHSPSDPTPLPLLTTRPHGTPAPLQSTPASDPAEPSHADLVRLGETLASARQALGEHQFDVAGTKLAAAEMLAAVPQHQALVQRTRRLAECGERFWKVMANSVAALRGAEELTVGSGELLVIVVETGPRSITIRSRGKNSRYSFPEMPPALALAIAKRQLSDDDPDHLILLGACLAMAADPNSAQVEEARKYWTLAKLAGADVDDLLLTLTDSYDFAP